MPYEWAGTAHDLDTGGRSMKRIVAAVVTAAALAAALVAAGTTSASFPGPNGPIVFQKLGEVWVVNADGSGAHKISPGGATRDPAISPDGRKVASIGSDPQRVKAGHEFDLFVADVDASAPAGKANARRLTTDQQRPTGIRWLPDSSGLVFQAGENAAQEVWYVDLGLESRPVRLSDGQHRCSQVSITAESRVAWIVHKGSQQKQQFNDLVLHPSLLASGHMRTLLTDQHISSYAISPDGRTLAWSGLGSMFLVNLETGESREIPLQGIHPQLLNHTVREFAWRPDGKVIAIRCGFLGGIAVEAGQAFPRMFAADKVFFIPVDWAPSAEALKVGTRQEDFPSPTADDPKAEVSPPAGDQSKPWWVRELPEQLAGMKWIGAEEAQRRLAKPQQ